VGQAILATLPQPSDEHMYTGVPSSLVVVVSDMMEIKVYNATSQESKNQNGWWDGGCCNKIRKETVTKQPYLTTVIEGLPVKTVIKLKLPYLTEKLCKTQGMENGFLFSPQEKRDKLKLCPLRDICHLGTAQSVTL
jgi:hypothetical protein